MQRNPRQIWGGMMDYRPHIQHFWGDVSPMSHAGFTPLDQSTNWPTASWFVGELSSKLRYSLVLSSHYV